MVKWLKVFLPDNLVILSRSLNTDSTLYWLLRAAFAHAIDPPLSAPQASRAVDAIFCDICRKRFFVLLRRKSFRHLTGEENQRARGLAPRISILWFFNYLHFKHLVFWAKPGLAPAPPSAFYSFVGSAPVNLCLRCWGVYARRLISRLRGMRLRSSPEIRKIDSCDLKLLCLDCRAKNNKKTMI